MTYGRSIFKALEKFDVDPVRWHELAEDRSAWRETLRAGLAPPAYRSQARPASPRIALLWDFLFVGLSVEPGLK